MRSAMNRFKLLSGIAASVMVLAASAVAQNPGEWTMTGRTPDLQRFSPLTQITKANVKGLKASWTFSTGVLNGHEGNPLVINNVMYVHSAFPNIVFALDLTKPGAPMIWKHVPAQPAEAKPIACCDLVNRGLAYHPSGKLFIELLAGDLLALDAKTGKQLWRAAHADYKTGSPNIVSALDLPRPGARMIWKHGPAQPAEAKPIACCDLVNRGLAYHPSGKLFIELLAGDLLALDAKTGKQLWRVAHADYKTGSTLTNAPIVIKDTAIAGISGGEFGGAGRVRAFDVNSGRKLWTMDS